MTEEIIIQIIESFSYLIIAFLTFLIFKRNKSYKKSIENEIKLLKDILYFRQIINSFTKENRINKSPINYRKFRKQVSDELCYTASELSKPSIIKQRLEELQEYNEEIDRVLKKLGN